jgi:hypothetical protein
MRALGQHSARDRKVYIQWHRLGGDDIAGQVEQEAQQVGDHSHEQDELGKLLLPPCALQVASAVEEGCAIDDQAGEVLLDDGSQGEDPGVDDGLARHDGQVGHAIAHAEQRLLDLLDPVRVGAQDEVEQGEEDGGCQQAARDGRQVDAGHGDGGRCGAVRCGRVRVSLLRQGQTCVAVAVAVAHSWTLAAGAKLNVGAGGSRERSRWSYGRRGHSSSGWRRAPALHALQWLGCAGDPSVRQ